MHVLLLQGVPCSHTVHCVLPHIVTNANLIACPALVLGCRMVLVIPTFQSASQSMIIMPGLSVTYTHTHTSSASASTSASLLSLHCRDEISRMVHLTSASGIHPRSITTHASSSMTPISSCSPHDHTIPQMRYTNSNQEIPEFGVSPDEALELLMVSPWFRIHELRVHRSVACEEVS